MLAKSATLLESHVAAQNDLLQLIDMVSSNATAGIFTGEGEFIAAICRVVHCRFLEAHLRVLSCGVTRASSWPDVRAVNSNSMEGLLHRSYFPITVLSWLAYDKFVMCGLSLCCRYCVEHSNNRATDLCIAHYVAHRIFRHIIYCF